MGKVKISNIQHLPPLNVSKCRQINAKLQKLTIEEYIPEGGTGIYPKYTPTQIYTDKYKRILPN